MVISQKDEPQKPPMEVGTSSRSSGCLRMFGRARLGEKSRGLGSTLCFVRASTWSLHAGVQYSHEQMIKPFPCCFLPLFQNESSCKPFLMKTNLICIIINFQVKRIFITMVSQEDLEMASSLFFFFLFFLLLVRFFFQVIGKDGWTPLIRSPTGIRNVTETWISTYNINNEKMNKTGLSSCIGGVKF